MRTVVVDTSILIDLAKTVGFDLFTTIDDHIFRITDSVRWELKNKKQVDLLMEAVKADSIGILRVDELADLRRYAKLSAIADEGEASCLVLAEREGADFFVATSDGGFDKAIKRSIGMQRILGLEDLEGMVARPIRDVAE